MFWLKEDKITACMCVWMILGLLSLAGGVMESVAQSLTGTGMHKDAKGVLITGRATGQAGEPSSLTVHLNGIDFTVTIFPSRFTSAYDQGASPHHVCRLLREQITAFTLGTRSTPEFDAECLSLAGEAALLLVQANPDKYEVPSAEDPDRMQWLKAKRCFLHIQVSSTDETMQLRVVK